MTSPLSKSRRRPARPRSASRTALAAVANDRADLCEVRCIDADKVARARQTLRSSGSIEASADTFRILGDPTRLRLVHALAHEELCVCDLALLLEQSQSTVSHSLRSLRQMRLVRYRKVGKVAYYSLDDDHIARLLDVVFEHVGELE